MKDEVRAIAEREHLINARRKDSQGICFLGKINYNDYIRRYLGERPGDTARKQHGNFLISQVLVHVIYFFLFISYLSKRNLLITSLLVNSSLVNSSTYLFR